MADMHTEAGKINEKLKDLYGAGECLSSEQMEKILNIMLHFGRVAKFRCRNNTAYRSFSRNAFRGIASLEEVTIDGPRGPFQGITAVLKEE